VSAALGKPIRHGKTRGVTDHGVGTPNESVGKGRLATICRRPVTKADGGYFGVATDQLLGLRKKEKGGESACKRCAGRSRGVPIRSKWGGGKKSSPRIRTRCISRNISRRKEERGGGQRRKEVAFSLHVWGELKRRKTNGDGEKKTRLKWGEGALGGRNIEEPL